MKKITSTFLFLFFVCQSVFASSYYADTIIDHNSGTGLDYTGDEHLPRALGPSDFVFLSIGETGYLTFGFDNRLLVNGIGNDVRFYTTSHSIFNEPADISASLDGTNFYSLGLLGSNRPSTWVGNGPSYEIWYQEFDLNDSELNLARYLKVTDLPGGFVSTDIDAISILNSKVVPEPTSMLLFGIGGLAMATLKRKKKNI